MDLSGSAEKTLECLDASTRQNANHAACKPIDSPPPAYATRPACGIYRCACRLQEGSQTKTKAPDPFGGYRAEGECGSGASALPKEVQHPLPKANSTVSRSASSTTPSLFTSAQPASLLPKANSTASRSASSTQPLPSTSPLPGQAGQSPP